MAELTTEAVAVALTAGGERPAARKESGWKITASGVFVMVGYAAAGSGEAVMKRDALVRWMALLGAEGWTVEGLGVRRLASIRVSAATVAEREQADG